MPEISPEAYAFLRFIADSPEGVVRWSSLVDRFGESEALDRVNELRRLQFLEVVDYGADDGSRRLSPSAWRLTAAGRDALALHEHHSEQQRQKEAANRREKEEERAYQSEQTRKNHHHDYLVAAFQIFLGFIIGVVAEHYCQILAFLHDVFHLHP